MGGDGIGTGSISNSTRGMMNCKTHTIDSIGKQGMIFTDYHGLHWFVLQTLNFAINLK